MTTQESGIAAAADAQMTDTVMKGVFLPGDATAEVREYPVPVPGPGQLLIRTGASGICGSDIGYIYRGYKTHKGLNGQPAYKGGHRRSRAVRSSCRGRPRGHSIQRR
jgi:hypothetical protein